MGDVKEFDYVDYILYYDCPSENDVLFVKDSFKYSDGVLVPIVYVGNGHNCYDPEKCLGHALIENRDDGVVAKCTFNDYDYGAVAKELFDTKDVLGISVYANHISYDLLQSTSLKIVTSANVMAVIVLPKIAIPKKKKESTLEPNELRDEVKRLISYDGL